MGIYSWFPEESCSCRGPDDYVPVIAILQINLKGVLLVSGLTGPETKMGTVCLEKMSLTKISEEPPHKPIRASFPLFHLQNMVLD